MHILNDDDQCDSQGWTSMICACPTIMHCLPKCLACPVTEIKIHQYTLINQSNDFKQNFCEELFEYEQAWRSSISWQDVMYCQVNYFGEYKILRIVKSCLFKQSEATV